MKKNKNKLHCALFILGQVYLFLLCNNAYCQYTEWTNYSFANEVNSIVEEDSLLWIGTDVGLIRYNKITQERNCFDRSNSPLKADDILQIVIDKYKNKWLITAEGLIKYKNDKWDLVYKSEVKKVEYMCLENDSVLWFCAEKSLWKYNNNSVVKLQDSLLEFDHLSCMTFDKFGNMWLGISDKGVLKNNGIGWTAYDESNSELPESDIECLFIDSKNRVWVSTSSSLCLFSEGKWKTYKQFRDRKRISLEFPNYIENIFEDNSGSIWLLTSQSGIRKFAKNRFTRYNYWNTNYSEINYPNCGLQDSQNNYWFGTHFSGGFLIKYDETMWKNIMYTSFPTSGYSLDMQFARFDSDGNLWVSTDGVNIAMSKFDGKEWKSLTGRDLGIHYYSVKMREMAIDSKGNLWFISDMGLFKFDGEKWACLRDSEPKKKNRVYYDYSSIAIDQKDKVWIGTSHNGLLSFNGNSWERYTVSNSEIPSDNISELVVDKNNTLWFGADASLVRFDSLGKFIYYNSANSQFPDCRISKLAVDNSNSLIIGTYNYGLIIYDGIDFQLMTEIDGSIKSLKIINADFFKDLEKNRLMFYNYGLPVKITDIVFEENGAMWIGTDGNGLLKIFNNKLSVYNKSNSGLITDRITSIAIDKSGYKLVGLYCKGIAKFK